MKKFSAGSGFSKKFTIRLHQANHHGSGYAKPEQIYGLVSDISKTSNVSLYD